MIELKNVTVEFKGHHGQQRAVDDVSLQVRQGEIYGIVGSSGAGKSTLLRTINLLQRPARGEILLDGRSITAERGKTLRHTREKIGMIFQHFNLMHTRTVFDNVAFPLRVAGKSRAEIARRVPEILALVGLTDKAHAYPSQLSGGQKQRVGIARAVANQPQVLLCDEPTSALDLESTAAILELLREINAQLGITIVLISHELDVIKAICHRVAVMSQGRVVEEGAVFDIFATPQHPFTQQLVSHTLDLTLPTHLTQDLQGTLVKILFVGDRAEQPVLSELSLRFGLSINILHGKIEYIGGRALGVMIALLLPPRPKHQEPGAVLPLDPLTQALTFLQQNTARVEVLHG